MYVISFINLGVLWVGQHNQYHFISEPTAGFSRADRWFLWINIGYLLLVSFMPLSTALLGHYPLNRLALFVYGANLLTATLVLALHWHYATATPGPSRAGALYRRPWQRPWVGGQGHGLPDSMSYPTTASTSRAPLAALAIRSTTTSGRET